MVFVFLHVALFLLSFAVAYWLWLSVKFHANKSKVLDRSEFEWLFERGLDGSFDLHDDDLFIEAVLFSYRDFDFRKELVE